MHKKPTIIPLPTLCDTPLVSVIVANYNYSSFIGEAIESVQRQSYGNLELVICDDGSIDNSCKVIENYIKSDPRIFLIKKENGGQASALNRAFERSQGDIICLLDADDFFYTRKISNVVDAFVRNQDAGIVIHDLRIVDDKGSEKGILQYRQEGYLGQDIPTLRMGLPMPQASGLSFRREVLEQILPLPEESFRSGADWAIAYIAAYFTKTIALRDVLSSYRIHGSNLSGTTSTSRRLDEKMIEKTLINMEKVIDYLDKYMKENYNITVPMNQVRNVIEHRIILGCLKKDKKALSASLADLEKAYRNVRGDYPFYRYLFWQTLSLIPLSFLKHYIVFSFKTFKFCNRYATFL